LWRTSIYRIAFSRISASSRRQRGTARICPPHVDAAAHTHSFNGTFSGTTQVSRYQKGKTNLDFTEARNSEWQWHQLGRMQVCTSHQTDNHASTPPLSFYRPDALPAAQPTASNGQSTEGSKDRPIFPVPEWNHSSKPAAADRHRTVS